MERNVYAPPAAAVSDPVEIREKPPWTVVWARILVWVSLAISVGELGIAQVASVVNSPAFLPIAILSIILSPIGIRSIVVAWLNIRMGQARNWARITLLIVFVLGFIYVATQWQLSAVFEWRNLTRTVMGKTTATWLLLIIAQALLEVGALVLLFTPRANRWFRAPATA